MSTTRRTFPAYSPGPLPAGRDAARAPATVVLYDGQCELCRRWVERLRRWDRGARLTCLSLHDPAVRRRFPDLSHDALMRQLHVVDRRGRRHRGAGAIRQLALRLPALWWLLPLLYLPFSLALWQRLYRRTADRRHAGGAP